MLAPCRWRRPWPRPPCALGRQRVEAPEPAPTGEHAVRLGTGKRDGRCTSEHSVGATANNERRGLRLQGNIDNCGNRQHSTAALCERIDDERARQPKRTPRSAPSFSERDLSICSSSLISSAYSQVASEYGRERHLTRYCTACVAANVMGRGGGPCHANAATAATVRARDRPAGPPRWSSRPTRRCGRPRSSRG